MVVSFSEMQLFFYGFCMLLIVADWRSLIFGVMRCLRGLPSRIDSERFHSISLGLIDLRVLWMLACFW